MSKRYMKTIHLIEEFPESERVKKSDGRMYQCIGKDSYDDMCQPFDHWIEHPMVVHYDGKITKTTLWTGARVIFPSKSTQYGER